MIEWRPLIRYEGIYSVSSQGHIRRDAPGRGAKVGRILRPSTANGYPFISIGKEKVYLHVAVARSFLERPNNNQEVNHKDGNKLNPCLINLEYETRKGNMEHAVKNGLTASGSKNAHAILNSAQVTEIRKMKGFASSTVTGNKFGISRQAVADIWARRTWKEFPR